jgi:uncharacterized protein YbjT (DUF2867 family)
MFAITGITGQVGGAIASRLLEKGLPVRAVIRNAEKAGIWKDRGAEVALADITDAGALTEAFSNVDGVFVLIPPTFDPAPGFPEVRAVVTALKAALTAARPKRIVSLSTIGAQASEPNLLSQHGIVEGELSALPTPIAFLRAGWFMENCAWDVAPARETGVIPSFLQPLDKPVPMVAVEDIGALAARLLQEDWSGKRIVELEGPLRVTPNDIAAVFSTILGKPVRMEVVQRDQWEPLFRSQGMQNPQPRMRMLDGFNEGWISFEGGKAATHKGATNLETALRGLVAEG